MPTEIWHRNKWCLGFVFSFDFQHVILLRKGSSFHSGLWNGVGGALEDSDLGSFLNAMTRECKEETGLSISLSRWTEVGTLNGKNNYSNWNVVIFATRVWTSELTSIDRFIDWVDADSVLKNPKSIDGLSDRSSDLYCKADHPVMIPLQLLHLLKMAPHGASLTLSALERIRDMTPRMTFTVESNNMRKI